MREITERDICARLSQQPQPPDVITDMGHALPIVKRERNAAVLVPLISAPDGWQVLFTRRTDSVGNHKGMVAFPGGAVDAADHGPAETAIRETREEIGLPPGQTRICGYLDNILEISGYLVTPVVGIIPWPFPLRLSEQEVRAVFTIPLDWLADQKNYRVKHFVDHQNPAMTRDVVFYDMYEGETVWGLTAYITIGLVLHLLNQKVTWKDVFEHVRQKGLPD